MPSATDALAPSKLTQTPMPGILPAVKSHPAKISLNLFLISVVGLFLELLLIRWVSTEIRIFAYLQNCVLVVCFLGLGMGCWDCRRPFALRDVLVPLSALVVLLSVPVTRHVLGWVTEMLAGFGDLVVWSEHARSGPELLARSAFGLGL